MGETRQEGVFYKKEIKEKGKRVFYEIDLKTLKYKDTEKNKRRVSFRN